MIKRKQGLYELYIKRILDVVCSSVVLLLFGWIYVIIAIIVFVKMGRPILFKQLRPGIIDPKIRREKLFYMYKFRTMTDERDENGELLPDEKRLSKFGKMLRSTSLDELPELINILKGDMSLIGPRPQLVRDMVFMSKKQRMRHIVRPGLSGLAQIKGRNAISWEDKLNWDLEYVRDISFLSDVKILLITIKKVFGKNESSAELDVTDDYGDALLKNGLVDCKKYDSLQKIANKLIRQRENKHEKI